jgi:hypothetical protein
MKLTLFACLFVMYFGYACPAHAQGDVAVKERKIYWGNNLEAAIISSAVFSKPGQSEKASTIRSSNILNLGFTLNNDFSNVVGVYTGFNIKNIGFIEKVFATDSTIKRRVYTLGVPLGIKIGNLADRNFFILGGGVDLPFNYREKRFVKRGDKDKFNEWFSDRTAILLPYAFAGYSVKPGVVVKVQYYPANFLNTNFTEISGAKPYAGYNVNLVLLSLGVDIHHRRTFIEKR